MHLANRGIKNLIDSQASESLHWLHRSTRPHNSQLREKTRRYLLLAIDFQFQRRHFTHHVEESHTGIRGVVPRTGTGTFVVLRRGRDTMVSRGS